MSKMSFLQKIGILIDVALSSYWLIIAIGILVAFGVILITNRKKKKQNKILYILFSLVICSFLLITYHESLGQVFEYLVENLFVVFLFPNYAFYFVEILITNIILWVSLFHSKTSDAIKKLNIVVYLIMNYLLMLVLSVIDINQLDIFTVESLYSNEKSTALMEISSSLFVTWVIFLLLYKIILGYVKKDHKEPVKKIQVVNEVKKLPKNYIPKRGPKRIKGSIKKDDNTYVSTKIPSYINGILKKKNKAYLPVETPSYIQGNIKKVTTNYTPIEIPGLILGNMKKANPRYRFIESPRYVNGNIKNTKSSYLSTFSPNYIYDSLKNNPEEIEKKMIEDTLTLDDYRKILRILTGQKEVKKEEKVQVVEEYRKEPVTPPQEVVDLERIKIEEMKKQEEERELEKYTELDRMFRSMK